MPKLERQPRLTNRWKFALYIGFYAGLIWGALKMAEHALKFTSVVPGFLLDPFFKRSFLGTTQGYLLGWASFILFSIAAAFLYLILLARAKGPWVGLGYGLVWWFLLYLLIGPLTEMVPSVTHLDVNTFVTDLCLFVLWGLFIGYSISLEFTDEREREPV